MVNKLIKKGRDFFVAPQSSVLTAATVIMVMVVASRVLGLVRQRTLAHFFSPDDLALFFAAFRLPDLIFEVLVYGTFSSAFIPVFTRAVKKGNHEAWKIASVTVNIGLIIFIFLTLIIGGFAGPLYGLIAPGFSISQRETIVSLTRILFAAQGFFVISYVLTGVLESLRRFLIPALAPLFYNLGIILGTIFLQDKLGLLGPTIGVVIGAFIHFAIQLPIAMKLGFRFSFSLRISEGVKKIGKLAAPRILEVSFLQISKMFELFFSSLVSTAAYTYFTFGNTLQLLPVGLFGTSIAKAALPTLSSYAEDITRFRKTLFSALYDMSFLIIPIATAFIILRIPIVRLVYGTDIFSWEATVQTGYVLSAFGVGVFFQAASALLARSFYALHNTRTPVLVSIFSILLVIICDFIFIRVLRIDIWGLAAAFSIGSAVQATTLFYLINKKLINGSFVKSISPILKSVIAATMSGLVMYFLLKIFDRSVWVKRISFLGKVEATKYFPFDKFVLDTRYTFNLLILTAVVSVVGGIVYIAIAILLKSEQVWNFFNLIKRIFIRRKVTPIPKEEETVSPTPTDMAN
ncbi:murein biosynthesis integral membrane protein MurJ [Candidatus Woesebacteria bacterium RIFCSPHIGHO2_01_FULL_37_10]|uniref:Probable lipid II flippase MurJ n=1 Tax=Candidatus Woesebacteria bacterium RIFCSPHIGHO2_01_FULL_37_10 TaxID=1802489 RepID=A0A1F7XSQ6_9BACT|nr:MAG: murein biosynthesis integral membrane protein MurJ [Candidatus Woesebacteria bacterium RIFCSPHIGHO2_01_FULL_37_10]